MSRRQRKLEKKRKKRDLIKKGARIAAANRPSLAERLMRIAARSPFGPCAISSDWDKSFGDPELVSVVVTHRLPDGDLLPSMALVDRTCLGVKNSFVARPLAPSEFDEFLAQIGRAHGGMEKCEPLVAQSTLFHAIDYARKLGFEPHPDFREALFGPRPDELIATPWHARERPLYISGPNDEVRRITQRLCDSVGTANFDFLVGSRGYQPLLHFDEGDYEFDENEFEDAASGPEQLLGLNEDDEGANVAESQDVTSWSAATIGSMPSSRRAL